MRFFGGERIKDAWWEFKQNRRAQFVVGLVAVLIILFAVLALVLRSFGLFSSVQNESTNITTEKIIATVPNEGVRRIDGVSVPWEETNFLPIVVIIENLESIRPQAGLSQANMIYEALAEGGITRFMAIYAHRDAIEKIGPIRSIRHYFVDWAEEYRPVLSYIGGSPQALGITGSSGFLIDLNQFNNPAYYYRDDEKDAPHNVFSNSELFTLALRDLDLQKESGEYASYIFKEGVAADERPQWSKPITIDFSTTSYFVEWRYDPTTNTYLRWNGGEEHIDINNNAQLEASNIVIQRVETSLIEDATGRLDMITQGEGEALLFQDGITISGQWSKKNRGDRTLFTYDGKPWQFNPGATWIEMVPFDIDVSY